MSSLEAKTANYFYLLVLLLLSTIGGYVQGKNIFLGLVTTEFGFILIPVVLYLLIKGHDMGKILKVRKLEFRHALMAIPLALVGWLVSEAITIIWVFLVGKWIAVPANPIPVPWDGRTFALEIATVGFTAALCEELFFRGFFMTAYEGWGSGRAIVMSGIFFALLHVNPGALPGIAFLGVLLAYSAYRTGSVFMSMIMHFVYNFISIVVMKLGGSAEQSGSIPVEAFIAWIILGAIAFLILLKMVKRLKATTTPEYKPAWSDTGTFLRHSIAHWPMLISFIFIIGQMAFMSLLKILN
ncbi:type II CAAX endopeptidase family protein [Caldanaerobius polysaccharolyticus]|uniref:type II CAAX endopeptidase family protein n=1 Tax=Caldanaerobius polysaccharolyticus TaxID=44256 RepID=UPI00047C97A6|nr:type II CAAX endopeptidase family protein [Caldanaerobius polysaccharolyticus]